METVPPSIGRWRPGRLSAQPNLLAHVKRKRPTSVTKSGLDARIGETIDELLESAR